MYDHHHVYWEYESRIIKPTIRKVRDFLRIFDTQMSIKLLRSSAKYRKIPKTISIERVHLGRYSEEYLVGKWSYAIVDSEGIIKGIITFELYYHNHDTRYFLRMWLQIYEFGEEIEYDYGDPEKLATIIFREILKLLIYTIFSNDPEERDLYLEKFGIE